MLDLVCFVFELNVLVWLVFCLVWLWLFCVDRLVDVLFCGGCVGCLLCCGFLLVCWCWFVLCWWGCVWFSFWFSCLYCCGRWCCVGCFWLECVSCWFVVFYVKMVLVVGFVLKFWLECYSYRWFYGWFLVLLCFFYIWLLK